MGIHKLTPARRKRQSTWVKQKQLVAEKHTKCSPFQDSTFWHRLFNHLQIQLWKIYAHIFFKKTLAMYQAKFWHGNHSAFITFTKAFLTRMPRKRGWARQFPPSGDQGTEGEPGKPMLMLVRRGSCHSRRMFKAFRGHGEEQTALSDRVGSAYAQG